MAERRTLRTALSHHFISFQKDEEQMVLSVTNDSDREQVMEIYNKTKITAEDMLREYTPAEVRELCERTKVKVKMYKLNCVWDIKKRFDKKKRLENKSERWVNRMFVKAASRKMVEPYTELEMEKYKDVATCNTKKENNVRLDRWHRQRARAAKSNGAVLPVAPLNISISSSEETPEQPEPNMPPPRVEHSPSVLESQPQSQVDESTMDELLNSDIQPAAGQLPLPDLGSEPNMWDIGDQDEVKETAEAGNGKPPGGVAETQLDSYDWERGVYDINSESLSLQTIGSTQNTEPDYECFGTQVVAASTQDTVESQPFV